MSHDPKNLLSNIHEAIQQNFVAHRSIMGFGEFFDLVLQHPERHTRSVAQYLRDALLHFGTETLETPRGTLRRFHLFDMPFRDGRGRIVGQEDAQNQIFTSINNFIRSRRVTRLVLLHGPNGSAKSSLINCIMEGLEHYSTLPEGALYRFNWIFPTEKLGRSAIGFGDPAASPTGNLDTFAFLSELDIDAKLIEELKDNPLFLIPTPERQRLLLSLFGDDARDTDARDVDDFILSDYIFEGDLSHKSRRIFDALLASYNGDFTQVLKHVQIERFYISRRYRQSAVTIEPQLRVDASSRQITVDRSLSSLPTSLQNQTLFEPFGPLVDGNRGVIEFNDFLKRHPDLNKYLLATSEKSTVPLDHAILFIDAFLIGSANEEFLNAFKTKPEYLSFKGRLELIRMPYLLDYTIEGHIYEQMLDTTDIAKHTAPHATEVAALWATLTRLTRPSADAYPAIIQDVISRLTPLEKARLYARGQVPDGLSHEKARELRNHIEELFEEGTLSEDYEGRYGMSPREMKSILLSAAQSDDFPCLSPLAVFTELKRAVRDPTVHPFLRLKPDGEFHKPADFIDTVIDAYLDAIDLEIRDSMGLVDEARYDEYFQRYIDTIRHWVKGEQMLNPITGSYEDPSEEFMKEVETTLSIEEDEAHAFRNGVISNIGAFRIDNPDSPLDLPRLFEEHFATLRESFFTERRLIIERIEQNLLKYINDDAHSLNQQEIETVESTLANLTSRYHYCEHCAREAIAFLMQQRYR